SPFRLRAGLRYTLQWACHEGHTYLPREKLIQVAADILGSDLGPVERELDELIISESVVYKAVNNTDACFLPYLYRMESECAARLNLLAAPREKTLPHFNIDSQTEKLETRYKISLAAEQKRAVRLALTSGALVITGGPGTGKTTILQFVITMLEKLGESFELCAPTGRAAKRMTEATGCEARTIHRLLEYGYGESGFTRNQDNPIDADVIIVDEMSMVDVQLLWSLLRATRAGTRLIMVGDADQLPSVGAGNVLRDIIASETVPVVRLTEIYRQGGRSAIVTNAHRINNGQPPILHGEEEFGFEPIDSAEGILRRLTALCSGKVSKLGAADPLKDIQVLSPMKKGALGVRNINLRLQEALNPPAHKKHERKYGETVFREGDKVMQVKNDYRMSWKRARRGRPDELGEGVYNGDLGTIMSIDLYEQTVDVLFDDEREALYEFSQLEELELAYCISIHKSQGSEFPVVILPLAGGPPMLMTRSLLYTAVTRARKAVYIIGHEECPAQMVANNQVKQRYSALAALMRADRGLQ
ncbi:MAG: AAA family ATPase, partial [Eubacteriales bacterium]|nr:AAA family ATPase [Eubacteriales bacterium]